MGQKDRFGQTLLGLVDSAAQAGARIYGMQAQAELDAADLKIAQESIRFRASLANNQDPANYIGEDGVGTGTAFADYQRKVQGILDTTVKNPIARRRASSLLMKYIPEDEAFTRERQIAKTRENVTNLTAANFEAAWQLAENPDDLLTGAKAAYQQKREELVVQSGYLSPKEFDDIFMASIAGNVTDIYEKGIRQAIDEGGAQGQGLEAALQAVDRIPDIEFSPTAAFRATPAFKAKMRERAEAIFKEVRQAREDGYTETLSGYLRDGQWGAIYRVLKDPGFEYWADPPTRDHYLGLYANWLADEQNPKDDDAAEGQWWSAYYRLKWSPGATQQARREYLLGGLKKGYIKKEDIDKELTNTYEDVLNTPDVKGVFAEIDAGTKGKKPLYTEGEAGQFKDQIARYVQEHQRDLRPGEVQKFLKELRDPITAQKMAESLGRAMTGEGVGGGSLSLDAFETIQNMVQSGELDGVVRYYQFKDSEGESVRQLRGPYSAHLEALHAAHAKYAAEDFGAQEAAAFRTTVVLQPEGPLHSGQLIMQAPTGEVYAYMVPPGKKDEALYQLGKNGWSIVKDPPKKAEKKAAKAQAKAEDNIAARARANAEEAKLLARQKPATDQFNVYADLPVPDLGMGITQKWREDWGKMSPVDKYQFYEQAGIPIPTRK